MAQESTRTARIEARIAPEALAIVKRAAKLQGRSVSDFVVAAAQEAVWRDQQAAYQPSGNGISGHATALSLAACGGGGLTTQTPAAATSVSSVVPLTLVRKPASLRGLYGVGLATASPTPKPTATAAASSVLRLTVVRKPESLRGLSGGGPSSLSATPKPTATPAS